MTTPRTRRTPRDAAPLSPRSFLRRRSDTTSAYLFAVATTLVAAGAALAIDLPLHSDTNLLPIAAVAVSSWYGGRGPGIVAVVLSIIALDFLLIPPPLRWKLPGLEPGIYLSAFLFVALIVNASAEAMRRARAQAEVRADELELQMEEVRTLSDDLRESNDALSDALAAAERVADQATKFSEVAGALSSARTVAEVSDVVLGRGLEAVGASRGCLWRTDRHGGLTALDARGLSEEWRERFRGVAVGDDTPVGRALDGEGPRWIRTSTALGTSYPQLHDDARSSGKTLAWAVLPLRHREENVGALLLGFSERSAQNLAEQAFTTLLAGAAADALHRAGDFDDEREARRDAEQRARTRAEVLGVVAHDLRNPLSLIASSAHLLVEPTLALDRREPLLRITLRAVRQMNRLIGDLLDATRLEAGHLKLQRADVDVGNVLHDVVESCRSAAKERHVALTAIVPQQSILVSADEDRLAQALGNLVGNAVKFTREGGRVQISIASTDDEVVFRVRDDGPGISAESLPYLFERFWQARDSDRRGIGLGLAITKGIVESHGGRIWVESTPSAGSVFSFTLPIDTGARQHDAVASLPAAG